MVAKKNFKIIPQKLGIVRKNPYLSINKKDKGLTSPPQNKPKIFGRKFAKVVGSPYLCFS